MKVSYLVLEDTEEYSALGGVSMDVQVPLASFNSKKLADSYIRHNSKPQQINSFPPLNYGKLELKKIASNPTVSANKLPNYKKGKSIMNKYYHNKLIKLVHVDKELKQLAKYTTYDDDWIMDGLDNIDNDVNELKDELKYQKNKNKK